MRRHAPAPAPARCLGILAVAGALAAGGCFGTPTSAIERMDNALQKGEMSIDDPTILFDTRGEIDLQVESFGGSIRIEAVEGMVGTTVEPVRRAQLGHFRRDEAIDSLELVDYVVEVADGEMGRAVLAISTSTQHPEPHFQGVDFYIRTGELGRVDVRTDRGRVWVKNNQEGVDIQTTRGDIRVVSDHPMNDAMVMVTSEGDIDYRAAAGSTGFYDLETMGGEVYQRFTKARVVALGVENGPSTFFGEVGDGDNPVVLRTTFGDIRVAVVEQPTDVGPIIVE